jgi:hypothetical protein
LSRRTEFSSGYELTFHAVTVRNPKLVDTSGFACRSGILSGITCRFSSLQGVCLFILESGNGTGNESTPYQPELDGTAAAARRRAETA